MTDGITFSTAEYFASSWQASNLGSLKPDDGTESIFGTRTGGGGASTEELTNEFLQKTFSNFNSTHPDIPSALKDVNSCGFKFNFAFKRMVTANNAQIEGAGVSVTNQPWTRCYSDALSSYDESLFERAMSCSLFTDCDEQT